MTGGPDPAPGPAVARAGGLIFTGAAAGPVAAQVRAIAAALAAQGAGVADICHVRAFYRAGSVTEAALARALSQAFGPDLRAVLAAIPVGAAGTGDGALSLSVTALADRSAPAPRLVPDPGAAPGTGFVRGLRRGHFAFLAPHGAAATAGLVAESAGAMQALALTLGQLGAGFGDVVRMNRWYHAAGTKAEWEPSARAVAGFYAEPGPVATAISLPAPLERGQAIRIELMAMLNADGTPMPKAHSWPEGHWDWPIHLPYRHGLACGGLGFVGGQVSLDQGARVLDPDDLGAQVARSLDNIGRVGAGLAGGARPVLLSAYAETGEDGLARVAAGLGRHPGGAAPAVLAGFDYLSYPGMRVEIEAILDLAPSGVT